MAFEKLEHYSLKDQFVQSIQGKIFSGELKAGDRLPPERTLAQQMGISRSLVNNGILELESQGFLRIEPRRGTFVNDYLHDSTLQMFTALMNYQSDSIDYELFVSMLDARCLFESESARLAAEKASDEELAAIRAQYDIMAQNPIGEEFIEASIRFHHKMMAASHNPVYAMLFKSIEPVVRHNTKAHYTRNAHREQTLALHRELLETLESRDAGRSAKAAVEALSLGAETLKKTHRKK